MTRFKQGLGIAAVSLAALGLSACGSGSSTASKAAAQVSCQSVNTELAVAQTAAVHAQQQAQAEAGTPGAQSAAAALVSAEGQIVTLQKRQASCATSTASNPAGQTATLVADENNVDPVLLTKVASWQDLESAGNGLTWYQDCLASRNGTTWAQVQSFADMEKSGSVFDQVIIIEKSSMSYTAARQALKNAGYNLPSDAPIKRVDVLGNTAGLSSNRCAPFNDPRSQVRVALVPPQTTEAAVAAEAPLVLEMCSNPLGLPASPAAIQAVTPPPPAPQKPKPPATTVPPTTPCCAPPTTSPPGTTTTKPPCHTCGTTTTTRPTTTTTCRCVPPTTTPPPTTTKPCPCVAPTTTPPPPTTRPVSPTTTKPVSPGKGDSGPGATNTTVPPTTVAPPPVPPITVSPTTNPPKPPTV